MKTLTALLTFFISINLWAQDPLLQKINPALDKQAKELTQTYSKELALNGEQIGMFENKVEEFLIRKEKIEREFEGREKLNMLYTLQTREIAEMDNILTRPQLELYKKIRPTIQPLEQLEEDKK
ncbi:hypothetical protein ACFPH8_07190 [Bizionia hallyeonensis]|uniref:LTXXQ motif family protein n=1 Tax=Bizionia hallyeonensis TaxID=1123757 RepID=A0ABW0C536_9FLAO